MRLSRLIVVALVLAVGALVYLLWPRSEPTPDEAVRRIVVECTRAAEKKDVAAIMEHVSERFKANEGLGKQEVKQVLAGQLFRGQWVRVFTTDLEVRTTSPSSVEMTGKFIFGRSDAKELKDLARESVVSSYQIDATFEREPDGEWRAVSARYQQADPF